MRESNAGLDVSIRRGGEADVVALADAFRQMWLDVGMSNEAIEPDYRVRVERFVRDGVERLDLCFFVAEVAGQAVGYACCQRLEGIFPMILAPVAGRRGYIWGVHVAEAYRRRGIGRRLTEACLEALRALGHSHAVLHAAPLGRSVYEGLGFQGTNEMRLPLIGPA